MYVGYGTLRELRWRGELDAIPLKGEDVVLPKIEGGYSVDRRIWRLDRRPHVVEITIR